MEKTTITLPSAPLWRRVAAMFYDALLLLALALLTTGLYLFLLALILGAEEVKARSAHNGFDPLLASILLFVLFGFFAKFWTVSGQTLGMQVWRVRVQNPDGSMIRLNQCLLRFMIGMVSLGLGGLGFWWMLVDKDKKTWHDRYSMSNVVLLPPKPKNSSKVK
ncbi:RDD family protein [Zooshikella marina]|uniref:RDD family protein n=1 Tax=Zooshikella ganghwensis TaxID=202772 RepID=UPI001BAF56B1|nr:RDD family protein [Zooshikella ganghwensis]MBU2705548.1 RDD family protein [Zooshikella ganghwensis]